MKKYIFLASISILCIAVLIILITFTYLQRSSETSFQKDNDISLQLPARARKPAVAGTFYSSNLIELQSQLNSYLNDSSVIENESRVRILVSPHAGIEYSGPTAAAGYKQLEGQNFQTVILLGTSHQAHINHAAVYSSGSWQTPLGEVLVNDQVSNQMLNGTSIITDYDTHQDDHVLEMQLIYLQQVLSDFTIVPILIGSSDQKLENELAYRIANIIDDKTLLVISTDLSHYPTKIVADQIDAQTIESFLTLDSTTLTDTVNQQLAAGYSNLDTCACGLEAMKIGQKVASILNINDFKLIDYSNSGDITSETDRVVGYAAIGGWSNNLPPIELDQNSKQEALEIARSTLYAHYSEGKIPDIKPNSPYLYKPLGAFVTLEKDDQLRGCIGEFEPQQSLYQVIQQKAIDAATKDRRFTPVTQDELKDLDIEISIMTPKVLINDWQDIELGRDGVVIQKGNRSGTFLPQVAADTGWSQEEFLSELCTQKVGLTKDCYTDKAVSLYTYQAQVFSEE